MEGGRGGGEGCVMAFGGWTPMFHANSCTSVGLPNLVKPRPSRLDSKLFSTAVLTCP